MRQWFMLLILVISGNLLAQANYPFQQAFNAAYQQNPDVPRGMLEAVAWNYTHLSHLTHQNEESCTGKPRNYTVMGLVQDGQGYFRDNLELVSDLSGIGKEAIKLDPTVAIMAYATAYHAILDSLNISSRLPMDHWPVLVALSELPEPTNLSNDFAFNSQLYVIYQFLNDPVMQQRFRFPAYNIDLPLLFGANYDVLSAPGVIMSQNRVQSNTGQLYGQSRLSTDYAAAIWNPASSCNYSSRNGAAITAVTVHTIQGTYSSAINWFQNCNAGVSAHYVIRSTDGQVTQMVLEGQKGWHVGSENAYTIGLEHEGYVSDPTWYTTAMYQSSADLVKDIVNSGYGINPISVYRGTAQNVLNSCFRIKGHIHYPNQTHTDPGVHWNWLYYHQLINDTITSFEKWTCNGTLLDNGGANGNYLDLTRYITVIQPIGADSITMSFTSFDLEQGYDSLYIYDGGDTSGTLIGAYTGQSGPGTVTAYSGKMTLLFTADCSVNGTGFEATWQCGSCQPLYVSADTITPASCSGDGAATLTVQGGAGPYTFSWSDGGTGATRNDLVGGTYTVTVLDQNSCPSTTDIMVPSTQELLLQVTERPVSCNGELDGFASLNVSTGTAPYTYLWGNGVTDALRDDLPAGVFSYTVTDAQGCEAAGTVQITQPDVLTVAAQFLTDGDTSYITGGTAPYTFDQDCVVATDTLCMLTVTDAKGCTWDSLVARVGFVQVGLADASYVPIEVYPNPVQDVLKVKGLQAPGHLLLYNGIGKLLTYEALEPGRNAIDLSDLPTGLYFYRVHQREALVGQGKLVKQ